MKYLFKIFIQKLKDELKIFLKRIKHFVKTFRFFPLFNP